MESGKVGTTLVDFTVTIISQFFKEIYLKIMAFFPIGVRTQI